jgi:hypothetical protein
LLSTAYSVLPVRKWSASAGESQAAGECSYRKTLISILRRPRSYGEGTGSMVGAAPIRGGRFSYGVDRTTVVRVVTFAAVRISCNNRSRSAGLATRTSSM